MGAPALGRVPGAGLAAGWERLSGPEVMRFRELLGVGREAFMGFSWVVMQERN
jgi:hypothetical protein